MKELLMRPLQRESLGNEAEGCDESPLTHRQAFLSTRMHEKVGWKEPSKEKHGSDNPIASGNTKMEEA